MPGPFCLTTGWVRTAHNIWLGTLDNTLPPAPRPHTQKVNREDLNGVPEFILSRIPQPEGQPAELFTLLTDQSLMGDVIKNARSGALRRAMYLAGNSVAAENVQVPDAGRAGGGGLL